MSVWWPKINHHIEQKVTYCPQCIADRVPPRHPMIPTEVPERPWQKIGVDFCEFNNDKYIILMDYYSKYIDVYKVSNCSTAILIKSMKTSFEKHGIPESIRSDSGVQFLSEEWELFKSEYDFIVETSSPYHHQCNGQAESGVKIFKNILKKCKDRHLGLLAYNTTPKECGYSPSQLLMGRILRTNLPVNKATLLPATPNHNRYRLRQMEEKRKQEQQFNKRHRVTQVKDYPENAKVWVSDRREEGVIKEKLENRKYNVETKKGGRYIRNSKFLFPMFSSGGRENPDKENPHTQTLTPRSNLHNHSSTIHRPTRIVKPAKRFIEEL
ncbi:uncharacterized protein K02A2.6-like [Macrosteles quadrilineatus]|uniref:uncharacterized protein K02A2.6-like n=1 Tax=Macrosteles quadrilineatus TaxID=74068 RepID=UPI0023E1CBCD|nr:uncharacterized protein K02A2.6-like [Macrosteles quadrilineatus]